MTAMRDRVLSVARSQLGTREYSDGSSKYGAWYERTKPAPGFASGAWCQMFQGWCANEVGLSEESFPRLAYTPYAVQWFKDRDRWGSTPRVGALVYYNFPGGDAVDHVEIVEAVRADGSIVTIGGNVSNAVQRLVRRYNIAGYGYPNYGTVEKDLVEVLVAKMPLLKLGSKGNAVRRLFYLLISHGKKYALDPAVHSDTEFTPALLVKFKLFQKDEGLVVDGECGDLSWAKLILP